MYVQEDIAVKVLSAKSDVEGIILYTIGAVIVVRLPSMVRNLISPTSSSPMP